MKKTREEIIEIIEDSSRQGQPIKVTKIIGNLVKRAYLETTIEEDLRSGYIVKTERNEYMTQEAYQKYAEAKKDDYDKEYSYIPYTDKQEKVVRKLVEMYYTHKRPISTTELGEALGYSYEEATYRVSLGVKAGFEHDRILKLDKNFYVPRECYEKEQKKALKRLEQEQRREKKLQEERKQKAKEKRQATLAKKRESLKGTTTTSPRKLRSYEELELTQNKQG